MLGLQYLPIYTLTEIEIGLRLPKFTLGGKLMLNRHGIVTSLEDRLSNQSFKLCFLFRAKFI